MFKKRKQLNYKPTNINDPWIIKAWNNPQQRAGIKLGLYGLFLLFVFLLIVFRGESKPETYNSFYNAPKISYEEKLNKLAQNNYAFNITVIKDTNKIIYKGKKNFNLEAGYKEDSNGIIKYYIENAVVYKLGLDQKEEITTLYDNVNSEYFRISYILDLIKDVTPIIDDKVYTYNLENGLIIEIYTTNLDISKIILKENTDIYELEFMQIGKIDDVLNEE